MIGRGRPLRFVALVGTLWISGRVALLWQATGSLPQAIERALPVPRIAAAGTVAHEGARVVVTAARGAAAPVARVARSAIAPEEEAAVRMQLALLAMVRFGEPIAIADPTQAGTASLPGAPWSPAPPESTLAGASRGDGRWSASGWLIVRPGSGAGAALGTAQLGGSQAGARVDYALGGGFALAARAAAPLRGPGRELGLGVAWKPAGAPVRLLAEQRIAVDGGRGGPSLAVAGGVSDVAVGAGFRLEGYGQAGAIARGGGEAYADGLARVARPMTRVGRADLDLGMGVWGGAQRGAERLDIGPTAALRVPVTGRALRVTLDWRQRVAGDARPGSGPALSLGSDF